MLINVTEKCRVSYINEENKEEEMKWANYSFRIFSYKSQKDNFSDAVLDFILNFNEENCLYTDKGCEYDGEFLESMGYINFSIN